VPEPICPRLRLQRPHRIRFDPHGTRVHDPQPKRGDRRPPRDRRQYPRAGCGLQKLRQRLVADGQVVND